MKKNNWSSYICGWIVFIMICISSIYTVLKTGNNVVIDTALLSLMVFWLLRCKERNILYADVFARASLSAMTSIASYMVAIKILKIDI